MSSLSRWILALFIVLSLVIVVRASQENLYYFPLAHRDLTVTPSPTGTATRTPTVTTTPTRTPTITRTPTPLVGLRITDILYFPVGDPLDEYVDIRNEDSRTANLKGATLKDESGNKYTFPEFHLGPGDRVRVWTGSGSNDDSNLYWGRDKPVWNDYQDCAYLRDVAKNKLDNYCYSPGGVYHP
ncbi:MAG TPA: lamin tail domain-containing protein [Anaerolineales bacterium]|nr:lamin tail domain-containing protein [Anaerolineales bacterium]